MVTFGRKRYAIAMGKMCHMRRMHGGTAYFRFVLSLLSRYANFNNIMPLIMVAMPAQPSGRIR